MKLKVKLKDFYINICEINSLAAEKIMSPLKK